jgi:hypothetical protein
MEHYGHDGKKAIEGDGCELSPDLLFFGVIPV